MRAFAIPLLLLQATPAKTIDLAGLLAERADPAARARRPDPPYRLETITAKIAEIEGPGALVRIEAREDVGTVRVRLDGAEEPVIAERAEKGFVLETPIPFAARCRVTADGRDPGSCTIDYRAYPAGTKVATATKSALEGAKPATRPAPAGSDTYTFSVSRDSPDGGLTTIDPRNATGPRAVTRIHLRAEATDLASALEGATLRLSFDGETTVEAPLGEFFGCVSGPEPHESADFTVAPGIDEAVGRPGTQVELHCRLVMPYREKFDLSIDVRKAGDLHVAGIVRTMPWTWDERTMRFSSARAPAKRIEGAGLLVGEVTSRSRRWRGLDAIPFDAGLDLGSSATAYFYAHR